MPEKETGLIGLFEFEQAAALKKYGNNKVTYLFCDNRSIKQLHRGGIKRCVQKGVQVYGTYLPIGGLPTKCFNYIKYTQFLHIWNDAIKDQGEPDIVHVHFPLITTNDAMWNLWKKRGHQVITTEHWTKVQNNTLKPYWHHMLCRNLNEAKVVISVSGKLKESMLQITGINREIMVIPNIVSNHFYYQSKVQDNVCKFITIGRLISVKRFDHVIHAFAKAFVSNQSVQLFVVGDGPERNKLKKLISDLKLENRVKMTGFLPNEKVAELIQKCDFFVSASVLETFGVPWIEAWCCGLPVIGAKGSPIDNYFTENNSCQFIAEDITSLCEAMQSLYQNRMNFDRKKISEDARSVFSPQAVVNTLMEVYESVM